MFQNDDTIMKITETIINQSGFNYLGCNLENHDFSHTSCIDTLMSGATLTSAVFQSAILRNIKLDKVNGSLNFLERGVQFNFANMEGASLNQAYFPRGQFVGVNLRNADLRNCYLVGADFSYADLTGADLTGAYLYRANFTGATGVNRAGAIKALTFLDFADHQALFTKSALEILQSPFDFINSLYAG